MPAEVESIFYTSNEANRFFKPWHGLGTEVSEAPSSKEAIKLAGLDWTVEQHPLIDGITGSGIPNIFANVRTSDGKALGVVKDRYKIVQNTEAFDFTDELLGADVKYDTAGSLLGGKKIWLSAKLDNTKILDDEFEQFVIFTNRHDGKGSVQACVSPIRVVCNNTLNLALEKASRSWSSRHVGDMNAKLAEARNTLELTEIYMKRLAETADKLATEKMTDAEIHAALNFLFPVADDAGDREKENAENNKNVIYTMYLEPNLANFLNTKWGFINAVADYVDHSEPSRHTETFDQARMNKVISGHKILDKAYAYITD